MIYSFLIMARQVVQDISIIIKLKALAS